MKGKNKVMNPLVSVIVPVYNTEKYLHQCIDSICNQTLKDIEIILVDDESKDGSLAILEEYAKKDSRVTVVCNVHQGEGSASARTNGLQRAKGKYLSFLDSDDYFDLRMLEKAYTHAEKYETDITVYDGVFFQDGTNEITKTALFYKDCLPKKEVFSRKDFPDRVIFHTTSFIWLSLIRREFALEQGLQFQAVHHFDDTLFVRSAYVLANRISLLPEILAYHRISHAESQSGNKEKTPTSILKASFALKQFLEKKGVFQEVRNGHAMHALFICNGMLSGFKSYEAFSKLYDALQSEYIEKLEFEESITNNLLSFDALEWIQKVKRSDKETFVFELKENSKRGAFYFGTDVIFPHSLIKKEEDVILYGAGNIGTGFYLQNMQHHYCNLVAWVDKNPDGKQIPVQGLSALKTIKCDKIIIAIDSAAVFEEVSNYLLGIGFAKEQIIYGIPQQCN